MENMEFYNALRTVPIEAQKKITGGKLAGFTDINPMWRIKRLTEVFGPAGQGWKICDVQAWTETAGNEVAAFVSINLYVKFNDEWSAPIYGIGGNKICGKGVGDGINDEAYKMAYTDAISVACKALGMAADIFFEKDRTKYNIGDNVAPEVKARRTAKETSPKPAYKPLDDETYWTIVRLYASGKASKSGGDYRTEWIKNTNAGPNEIKLFDQDVQAIINGTF